MTTESLVRAVILAVGSVALVGLSAASCGPSRGAKPVGSTLGGLSDSKGCDLFVTKCSRCHEVERIGAYRASRADQWASLVTRMRRLRGSNINKREGDLITGCLVERQFGGDEPPDKSMDEEAESESDEE